MKNVIYLKMKKTENKNNEQKLLTIQIVNLIMGIESDRKVSEVK